MSSNSGSIGIDPPMLAPSGEDGVVVADVEREAGVHAEPQLAIA
jgi:hypothetical protein